MYFILKAHRAGIVIMIYVWIVLCKVHAGILCGQLLQLREK
jgi:hypothetical protein